MKVLFVVVILVAAVAAQETESREQPSEREGRAFPDFHEALYRPRNLASHFRRGAFRSSEEGPAQARVQIPDGEYKAGCKWVCSGGVCELYC